MDDLVQGLATLGVLVVASPIIYLLMKATDYRKKHDDR